MSAAARGRSDAVAALVLIGGVVLLVLFISWMFRSVSDTSGYSPVSFKGDGVGLVEVIGPIYDARQWIKELDDFRRDDNVRAVVVRIDSPGGGVAASQELYTAIRRFRDAKPVVVSMGSVAASGGYYAALAADTIVANPGTTTGSIGVLLEAMQFAELMKKVGIVSEIIKSGEFKDTGSPFRKLTPREKKYLQSYVNDAFGQFVETVADERGMELGEVRELADGRIFTGRQALDLGLVDLLGDQYEAFRVAGEMCDLGPEPEVILPPKKRSLDWLDLLLDKSISRVTEKLETRPGLQYRWRLEQ